MKQLFYLLIFLITAGCSGGGGTATEELKDITNQPEGEGPALNISNAPDVQSVLSNAISIVEQGFDQAEVGAASKGMFIGKGSVNASERTVKLCREGQFSEDINNAALSGTHGNVTLSGSMNMKKTSDDTASGTATLTASFDNFSDYYSSAAEHLRNFVISGNATKESNAEYSAGIKSICDAVLSGNSLSGNTQVAITVKDHSRASISLAGSVGGAVTFDYTEERNISSDGQSSQNVTGTAILKSGGTQINCTVDTVTGGYSAVDVNCD